MKYFLICFLYLSALCSAQQPKNMYYSSKEGAIKGYDPVAYFKSNHPMLGNKNLAYEWKGGTWYFASLENKNLFVAQPEKFAPQYGGYCAYGYAKGYAVKIDPEAWSIVDGKLYLNYNKEVQMDWDKDRLKYIKLADINYTKFLKQ